MSTVSFPAPTRSTKTLRSHVGRTAISLLAALGLLLIGSLASAPAWAHNTLQSTDPADGDTLDEAPDAIVLTFNEPVLDLGNAISVTNPNGDEITDGEPVVDNNSVTQALSGDLPAGDYEAIWRVTSADGHPIDGEFTFSTTNPAHADTGAEETPEPSVEPSEDPSAAPTTEGTDAPGESAEPTSPAEATTDAAATDSAEDLDEATSNTARNVVIGAVILLVLGGGIALFVRKGKGQKDQGNQDGQNQPGEPDA